MAPRPEAYVDTSALIAFADRSDSFHHLFRRAFADPPRLITTVLVIAEGHGWFLRRFDSYRALSFLAMVDAIKPLTVLGSGTREHRAGTELLRQFSDQSLTLTDAVGLHIMERRNIRICWSTDFHLGLTGIPLLIHELS
jgi:predicted nucleic acid-binding protein